MPASYSSPSGAWSPLAKSRTASCCVSLLDRFPTARSATIEVPTPIQIDNGSLTAIRGGGNPSDCMAFHAVVRMGPPPWSLAAEANGCFMVRPRVGPTEYKVAARCSALPRRAPLGSIVYAKRSSPHRTAVAPHPG
ncbi:protein of unknown function [Rhodovastum atsumiense]|nr:protein of unknown function [Rhodovastum atsumiense]